ncbi:MAG TPA: hypothetical protein VF060_29625 [Trebonia sp.]
MRLTSSRRRPEHWWLGLGCAAGAVVMAITVLKIGASAPPSVGITGTVPHTAAARSYDILVTPPGADESAAALAGEVNPSELGDATGGITLAQYGKIQDLPGVAVAAPLTMVGYLPFTASVPVTLAMPAWSRAAGPVTVTVRMQSDNGLSAVTWDDDVIAAGPGSRSATLAVRFSWTFQLPLIAVDPAAEARLMHLDSAVTSGSYLPENAVPPSQPVPMLLAGSVANDDRAEVGLPGQTGQLGDAMTLTAAGAYQQLVASATGQPTSVPVYWTAAPVRYQVAANGDLRSQPAVTELLSAWPGPSMWTGAGDDTGTLDVSFRSVQQHSARDGGTAVRATGVFDPARVAGAATTPSPYRPGLLTGADANSRTLLGDRPLAVPAAPGGLPGSAASLVMPLADLSAFTSRYTGSNTAAPIGAIRIRVAGADGDSAASVAKIRAAAQEIVRATGLQVEMILGATDVKRVVDLPAGLHGRPPLRVYQNWYLTGTRTTVWTGPGAASFALFGLGLAAGETVIFWNAGQLVSRCRRELLTLRALGWSRRELVTQLSVDFLPAVLVILGGILGAAWLAGHAIGSGAVSRLDWAWLLLSIPAAITWLAVRPRRRLRLAPLRPASPARRIRRLLRTPAHVPLRVFVVTVAAAALAVELASHWALAGTASAWTGRSAGWPGTVVDALAVLLIAALATLILADLGRATRRERAAELSTLRAIGWPAPELDRQMLWHAVWPGLLGGLVAGAAVPFGLAVVSGAQSFPLAAVGGAAVISGVVVSLLGAAFGTLGQPHRMFGHPDMPAEN